MIRDMPSLGAFCYEDSKIIYALRAEIETLRRELAAAEAAHSRAYADEVARTVAAEAKAEEKERVIYGMLKNSGPCGACAEGLCCGSVTVPHEGCVVAELFELRGKVEAETILCAAVRVSDGTVFYGHRHGYAIKAAVDHGYEHSFEQGFVTTRRRYVDRVEGRRIFEETRASADSGGFRGELLFSEDLYARGDQLAAILAETKP